MITLWHNPRCSKSRAALAILEEAGVPLTLRRYLEDAPSAAEITALHAALGRPPVIDMMRRGEKTFGELGLGPDSTDADLIDAMAAHPILIERPVGLKDGRAVIARPPELIRSLL